MALLRVLRPARRQGRARSCPRHRPSDRVRRHLDQGATQGLPPPRAQPGAAWRTSRTTAARAATRSSPASCSTTSATPRRAAPPPSWLLRPEMNSESQRILVAASEFLWSEETQASLDAFSLCGSATVADGWVYLAHAAAIAGLSVALGSGGNFCRGKSGALRDRMAKRAQNADAEGGPHSSPSTP